jgi:hypothetical protein
LEVTLKYSAGAERGVAPPRQQVTTRIVAVLNHTPGCAPLARFPYDHPANAPSGESERVREPCTRRRHRGRTDGRTQQPGRQGCQRARDRRHRPAAHTLQLVFHRGGVVVAVVAPNERNALQGQHRPAHRQLVQPRWAGGVANNATSLASTRRGRTEAAVKRWATLHGEACTAARARGRCAGRPQAHINPERTGGWVAGVVD